MVEQGSREEQISAACAGSTSAKKNARILALEILSTPELSGRQQPTPEELMKNERISRRFCRRGLRVSYLYPPEMLQGLFGPSFSMTNLRSQQPLSLFSTWTWPIT